MAERDRGWNDDPFVPISGTHVSAVIEDSGLSVTQVAREIGVSQPRLHYIVSGKVDSCRANVRDKLAEFFAVQSGWLAGDENCGPFHDRTLKLLQDDPRVIIEKREWRKGLPPLAELKATKLIEECIEKWEADLKSGLAARPNRNHPLSKVRESMKGKRLRAWLGQYFQSLLTSASTFKPHLYAFPAKLKEADADLVYWWFRDDAGFAEHWVDALSCLLRPWLDGTVPLDYKRVYRLLDSLGEPERRLIHNASHSAFKRVIKDRWRPAERKVG